MFDEVGSVNSSLFVALKNEVLNLLMLDKYLFQERLNTAIDNPQAK
jgi:hypothetical protein